MALLTPLELDDARRIGRAFGLDVARVEPVFGGSVNSSFLLEAASGRRVFVRVYEEQDRTGARRELGMLSALARAGVPTPEPLQQSDGESLAAHRGKPVALFPWVEGESLCQERVRPAHTRAVGAALAQVHLSEVPDAPPGRFELGDLQARLARVSLASAELAAVARDIGARLVEYASRRDRSLPTALIHGDLFRDNVLWHDGSIAALIDFESASRGACVYDLMVCVLAWCFGDGFELELVQGLLEGYRAVRRLSEQEIAQLGVEGAVAALRFATTRITDYTLRAPPGEPPLRDYRRFLARLAEIEAGKLEPVFGQLR